KVVTVTSPWGPSTEEEVWHDFVPDTNEDGSYVTKTVDGKTVYEGHYKNDYIVLGDLQKSAANTLNIIMQSSQMGRLFDEITAKSYSEQFDLQDQFVSDKSGVEKNMTSYTSITDIYDWGPAVTKVIVALGQTVNAGAIDKDTFSVYVTRIDDRFDHPAFDEGYRLIKKAYVSDENGKAVSSGDFVTLEMEVGPSITLSSPINYYTGGNLWIGYEMQIAQKKTIIDGETILSGIEAVNCVRQVRNLLDAFVFKQSAAYDGITYGYAEYTPKTDSKKNPLIIWLHGGGEGGTDPTIPITANKVVNLATPEIQTIFDGAYVLAPQAETYWMHSIGEGFANGTSIYEDSLMAFIRDYVAGNPDIDANRVYVGGCSNGGYMTMLLIRDYPEFFAASFPVCEGLNDSASVTDDLIQALKELSIWFVAAKTDRTLPPLNYSIPTYIRLREAGAEDVHMTLLEDVHDTTGLYKDSDGNAYEYDGHWSWVFVYNNECETLINGKITSLMEWLASHSL
ncbi:MAG TPA: prolyl oligopeptidase family serine peptidase, partial [Thermotogota bacterium]|nr:prolyl oligopeptidase family serine peptidase [Thermotogota bacterium]HPR97512.1 prolyl oligopeptidase family serine peptidase [Thermotogota bacterium]